MDEFQRREDMNKRVIENYEQDEKMMILIFAQWCVNNDLDPLKLYEEAYPEQGKNKVLEEMLAETIEKGDAEQVDDHTVLNVLQLFGNDDLAFKVQDAIEKRHVPK